MAMSIGLATSAHALSVGDSVSFSGPTYRQDPNGDFHWNHFPEICSSGCSARSGNVVRMWQMVLYADYGSSTGQSCSTFVDGDFGPTTTSWTRRWQTDHQVGVDGRVGPQTWGRADDQLTLVGHLNWVNWLRYGGYQRGYTSSSILDETSHWVWTYDWCQWS